MIIRIDKIYVADADELFEDYCHFARCSRTKTHIISFLIDIDGKENYINLRNGFCDEHAMIIKKVNDK